MFSLENLYRQLHWKEVRGNINAFGTWAVQIQQFPALFRATLRYK